MGIRTGKRLKRRAKVKKWKSTATIEEEWFKPEKLYKDGIPGAMLCHISNYPESKRYIRDLIKKQNVKNALEIGPGHNPVISHMKDRVYLDISKFFLKRKRGNRVKGTVEALPFKNKKFDIVVMNDVLSNIPPIKRKKAMGELARVGNKILILEEEALSRTEKGYHKVKSYGVKGMNVNINLITKQLKEQGFDVSLQKDVMHESTGFYSGLSKKAIPPEDVNYKEIRYILLAVPKRKKLKRNSDLLQK